MKVACIGNMNNNFFSLVRFLRARGVDAELLMLDNELDHFGPQHDAFDETHASYTRRVPWGDVRRYRQTDARAVAASVAQYDALVACGSAPAFLARARRAVDVFAPYGTDVMDYPFLRLVRPRGMVSNWTFRLQQRRAIQDSGALMFDHSNPDMDRIVRRLGYGGRHLPFAIPMVYTPIYNPYTIGCHQGQSEFANRFRNIRAEHDVVVFSSNRHVWTNPTAYAWDKGTERLICGFAQFVARRPDARGALVLFEYGSDVGDSRQLVSKLGIDSRVFWFPTMARRDLMLGLSLADFGVGELAHSFMACGTIYESLAMAKPLLGYRDDAAYREQFATLYPMANVGSAEDVARVLSDYLDRPSHYKAMGEAGRQWFQRYGVDEPLDALMAELGIAETSASGPASPVTSFDRTNCQ